MDLRYLQFFGNGLAFRLKSNVICHGQEENKLKHTSTIRTPTGGLLQAREEVLDLSSGVLL